MGARRYDRVQVIRHYHNRTCLVEKYTIMPFVFMSCLILMFVAEEPSHHAKSTSDRQLEASDSPKRGEGGLTWLTMGVAGVVVVIALLAVGANQI